MISIAFDANKLRDAGFTVTIQGDRVEVVEPETPYAPTLVTVVDGQAQLFPQRSATHRKILQALSQ